MSRTTFVIVALFLNIFTSNANAQSYGFAQFESQAEGSGIVPTVDLLIGGSIADTEIGTIGIEGFSLITEGWAEAYAGPTYTPIPQLTIGFFVGMETSTETLPRFAAEVIVSHEWFAFFGAVEFNSDSFDVQQTGLWYKVVATATTTDWLRIGLEWRRFAGLGPHIDVTVPGVPLEFWVSWTPIEPEGLDGGIVHFDRFLFGGKVVF